MHEAELALAVLPEPPRLFRLKLLPYSIGHELHLYRRASPFFFLKRAEFDVLPYGRKLAATMGAIHVCHQGFEANAKGSRGWSVWRSICRLHDLDKTIEAVRAHILSGHAGFQSELPSGDGHMKTRVLGAPELLRMYQFVCDTISEREIAIYSNARRLTAWDYPLALAYMHWQTRAELDGRLEVYSRIHQSFEQEIARREALAAEKAEKERCPTP